MSDNNQNPSTVQSYVDSATGMAQRAVNTVTGSSNSEQTASSAGGEAGGEAGGAAGGAAAGTNSSTWDQTVGSAKETIGNLTGVDSLRKQGIEQNQAGKETEARDHLKNLGQGAVDRAQGAVGSVGAALTGDREQEDKWRKIHDEGKDMQRETEQKVNERY